MLANARSASLDAIGVPFVASAPGSMPARVVYIDRLAASGQQALVEARVGAAEGEVRHPPASRSSERDNLRAVSVLVRAR
jgi:hypothetical protein